MDERKSRFVPQHRFWDEDLADREGQVSGPARMYGDVQDVNAQSIGISRASNMLRGLGVLFGPAFLILSIAGIGVVIWTSADSLNGEWWFPALTIPVLYIGLTVSIAMLRLDLKSPRDPVVRFGRVALTVRCYEADFIWWNPFARWPSVIKEFDWSNVQAEIQKQAGFNGKAYVVRYALVLCVCKPGTYEVIDRITLLSNRILTKDLEHIWNYLRRYMAEGPDNLPPVELLPREITLRRSFFEYMRWWDPTAEGRALRKIMPGWLFVFNSIVTLLMFPMFAGMGLGHYIAMRVAPEPDWENTPVVRVGSGSVKN